MLNFYTDFHKLNHCIFVIAGGNADKVLPLQLVKALDGYYIWCRLIGRCWWDASDAVGLPQMLSVLDSSQLALDEFVSTYRDGQQNWVQLRSIQHFLLDELNVTRLCFTVSIYFKSVRE